jgi:outer membrane protein TolC
LRRLVFSALLAACTPHFVLAQALAAEPAAPVPSVPYRSAVSSPQPVPLSTEVKLPDWVRANADVGQNLRGHVDILKWEAANTITTSTADPAASPQAFVTLTPNQAMALALKHRPGLIADPQANALERARLDSQVLTLSHSVQRAWVNAVSALQTEVYLRQVAQAAQTGAELGQRMTRVGNWSRAQLLQEQLLQSAATSQLAQAQQASFSATEDLVRLLGLWGSAAQLNLPSQLPGLPATVAEAADLEATAVRQQPELALARIEAEQASASVADSHLRQWQQAMDVALQNTKPPASATLGLTGLSPVLNSRQVSMTHALERAIRTQAKAHSLAVATRSQAREAYFRYRTAIDMVQHQREAATLATAMQDEVQLRYNGMLKSTWDLLASAKARLHSEIAAQQAQRDAWLAYLDLQAVLNGAVVNFSSTSSAAGSAPAANPGH